MVTALLPMKANSERVKGKNFKVLGNKPLYRWILDALLQSRLIDRILINTDASSLLFDGPFPSDSRVEVRERKPELCGDYVSMNRIIESDVEHCGEGTFLMTHTTNPFISTETIDAAIDFYHNNLDRFDSLFSVTERKARYYDADVRPLNHNPDILVRTQDLQPYFEENSCVYIFSDKSFNTTQARIGRTPYMFVTPPLESIDIDEPEDWKIAAAISATSL